MERYAMYLRKSRADMELEALGNEETLSRHKTMLYALAERHSIPTTSIDVYHEIVSGDSISARPEMQRLLDAVWARTYAGVLVVEVERLARGNTRDQGEVAEAFQYSNTLIITPAKVYDPNNESDETYFEFGLFMSRQEYKTIKRRLRSGKEQSVKDGNYVPSMPPYGYSVERTGKRDRILVENPAEAQWVRRIFEWKAIENLSTQEIVNRLNAAGVKPRNADDWSFDSVKKILRNYHYIGMVSWNSRKRERVLGEDGEKRISRIRKEPELYKGKHKPLVDEELFYKAQESKSVPARLDFGVTNPLAGLMFCADCGAAMSLLRHNVQTGRKRTDNYRHSSLHKTCHKKSCRADVVLEAVVDGLKSAIKDCEIQISAGDNNAVLEAHSASVAALKAELEKLQRQQNRLFGEWESDSGIYTRDEFLERKAMYTARIADCKERLKVAEENAPQPIDYSARIETLHKTIDLILDDTLSGKDKNDFLREVIERIDYDVEDFGVNRGAMPILDIHLK